MNGSEHVSLARRRVILWPQLKYTSICISAKNNLTEVDIASGREPVSVFILLRLIDL